MPLGRDLGAARKAYSKQDIEALIASHDNAIGADEDHAGDAGKGKPRYILYIVCDIEKVYIKRKQKEKKA